MKYEVIFTYSKKEKIEVDIPSLSVVDAITAAKRLSKEHKNPDRPPVTDVVARKLKD